MASTLHEANKVLFGDVCNLLEQLYKKKVHVQEKERILIKYIRDFKCTTAEDKVQKKNTSFYPILRLLVPSFERERGAYNLKEPKLGVLLVKVLSLNKQSLSAQKLLNRSLNSSQDGDFGNVAYFVLTKRVPQKSSTMTVGDVNEILDKISSAEVGNKGPVLDDLFTKVIRNLTAEQIKWFLRIILKDLKLGMSAKRILACYHPDAPEHYEKYGNLAKVCDELDDGNVRPLEMGVEIFYAVSPMLSERLAINDVEKLPRKTYHVEQKFDGERFQIHMENQPSDEDSSVKNHVYEYFSRKGFANSSIYGKSYDSGMLTPHLKHCFSSHVTSFILDGEMMGWDKRRRCFGSKGMAFDVKKLTDKSQYQPCFCAFDILYFNGRSLVGPEESGGIKLSERLKLLDAMFMPVPGVIQRSTRTIVTQSKDILDALNVTIDNQDEGIVVKDVDSYYIANKRNAGWYKIKPEYSDSAMEDMDLVVIGIHAPSSPRHGMAKSFLLAVLDSASGELPPRWVCIGCVATGLMYDERDSVCSMLARKWVEERLTSPPPELVFNKAKPDFWIMPEHSIVFTVRSTALIRSSSFGARYTLYFPRITRIREDKSHNDVLTLAEFNKLVENADPVIKLATKRIGDDILQGASVDAKIRKKRAVNLPQVPDELKTTTVDVEVISQALKGRKICILSDDEDCSKDELVKIVVSHGGKVVANPGLDTWVSVVGRLTFRARNLIAHQVSDVTSTAWLRALPPAPCPVPLSPLDLISMAKETRQLHAREYDAYGDSYLKFTDEDTLKRCFQKMERDEPEIYLTKEEMLHLDRELFGDENPYSYLRSCYLHITGESRSLLSFRSTMYGATLCDLTDKNLTHVVVPKTIAPTEIQNMKEKMVASKALVVSEDWLEKCHLQGKLASDTVFSM